MDINTSNEQTDLSNLGIDINFVIQDQKQATILKSFLREILDYSTNTQSISTCKRQREIFIFYGPSESGKSYLLNRIQQVLGKLVQKIRPVRSGSYYISTEQLDIPLLIMHAGKGSSTMISATGDSSFFIWETIDNFNGEATFINMISYGNLPVNNVASRSIRSNLIYVTEEIPPKDILDKGVLIHFPYHIPSMITHIRNVLLHSLSKKLIPDLAKLILEFL